jgi:hypothetical protein
MAEGSRSGGWVEDRRRHQGRGVLLAYRHAARPSAGP